MPRLYYLFIMTMVSCSRCVNDTVGSLPFKHSLTPALYVTCRCPHEKLFEDFYLEILFQACFPNRPKRFKIRNEVALDDFGSDLWKSDWYLYLIGYRYGLDVVPWSLCCLFGVEIIPQVKHENVVPSQHSGPKIKNSEMVNFLALDCRFYACGNCLGRWFLLKWPRVFNNQLFSVNFRPCAHRSRAASSTISSPIRSPSTQIRRICLIGIRLCFVATLLRFWLRNGNTIGMVHSLTSFWHNRMRAGLGARAPRHIDNPPYSRSFDASVLVVWNVWKVCYYWKVPTA